MYSQDLHSNQGEWIRYTVCRTKSKECAYNFYKTSLCLIVCLCLLTRCAAERNTNDDLSRSHASSNVLHQMIGEINVNQLSNSQKHSDSLNQNKPVKPVWHANEFVPVELDKIPVEPVVNLEEPVLNPESNEQDKPSLDIEPVEPVFVYNNMTSALRRRKRQQSSQTKRPRVPVTDSGIRSQCYACTFMFENGHEQGNPYCDDPFQQFDVPMIHCKGPCGKIYRKHDNKGGFMLKRDCIHNCKEVQHNDGGYTKCCTGMLCNSSHKTLAKPTYQIFFVIIGLVYSTYLLV